MPERIQRKRSKGFRTPANTIYVGRPGEFGNPYKVGDPDPMIVGHILTPLSAVRMYEWYLEAHPELKAKAILLLRGHNLSCWCPIGKPCHADYLIELCNSQGE